MGKKRKVSQELRIKRPPRARLSAEESLKRMEEFPKRRAKFIAAVRRRGV